MPGLHTIRITEDGLQVFPRIVGVTGSKTTPVRWAASLAGHSRARQNAGGRHSRRRQLVVAGPSGTGKPRSPTQFMAEGRGAGRTGHHRMFEERPKATYSGRLVGPDIEAPPQNGTSKSLHLRPLDLSVDEMMHEIPTRPSRSAPTSSSIRSRLRDGARPRLPCRLSGVAVPDGRLGERQGVTILMTVEWKIPLRRGA